jgi:hypothetical protein
MLGMIADLCHKRDWHIVGGVTQRSKHIVAKSLKLPVDPKNVLPVGRIDCKGSRVLSAIELFDRPRRNPDGCVKEVFRFARRNGWLMEHGASDNVPQ